MACHPTPSLPAALPGPGGRDALAAAQAVAAGEADPLAIHAEARERLRAAEPRLAATETLLPVPAARPAGPLAGVVAGIKDLIAVAGVARRCGAPALFDAVPQPRHATVVQRLEDAGATLLATLAMHALAFGVTGRGVTNPAAPDRLPGGSSSGSAVAVAAGAVHVALGSDTGGSVRIPASCCGVAGLKTTWRRLPTDGVADLAPSLDTVGPLARDTSGCALALAALDPAALGVQDADVDEVLRAVQRLVTPDPAGLRVGVPRQAWRARVDPAVRRVWQDALDGFDAAGATVSEVSLPTLPSAPAANVTILLAEAAATHAATAPRWEQALPRDVAKRLRQGQAVTSEEVAAARTTGMALAAEAAAAFESVDVLCLPTLPCPAPAVDAREVVVEGQAEPVTEALTRFTNPWNLTGLPAGSVLAGHDDGGAPVGVQLVGAAWQERRVLAAMAAVEACRALRAARRRHG